MRVFVTGHRGMVGRLAERELRSRGDHVVGFDLRLGHDICDIEAVRRSIVGCDAVLHLACLPGSQEHRKADGLATNVGGTWNVLCAAREAGIERFVFTSSVNALGVFRGEALPRYFPIDDEHPAQPTSPYGQSKLLAERLCEAFTRTYGMSTICLRPPAIWPDDLTYDTFANRWRGQPQSEFTPFWEYGAYIDGRDVATACYRALHCDFYGHATVLLAGAGIATATGLPSRELAHRIAPSVPWREIETEGDPTHGLIDSTPARRLLDWEPHYSWAKSQQRREAARIKLPAPLQALRLHARRRLRWLLNPEFRP